MAFDLRDWNESHSSEQWNSNFSSQNLFSSPQPSKSSQHELFSFYLTSSSSEFPKKLDPPSSSLEFPKKPVIYHALDTSYLPISSSEECSSNSKVKFNYESFNINDSIWEKISNRPASTIITETILSSFSNLESKTSNLNSNSLLVAESSSL